jgi:phenylacetate-CoA ligase
LIMSSLRLNESTFPAYLKKIREFKPRFIIAYPAVAFIFARYFKTHTIAPIESLKGIICSSETLYEWQQKCISESFNAMVFAYYGLTEKCCIAYKLPDSNHYAFMPTYGFVEVINKSDQWCSEEGESGEVIATGLNSLTTPLIRYRTQDVCVYSGESSGNHFGWPTVKGMTGRISEFLIDKSGNMVTFTCSDELFWTVLQKLNAYQFVQDIPGKIQLKLDLKQALTEEEHKKILLTFYQYYPNFEVEFIFSESIPRTQSGKFRYLIQNLPYDCQPDA